MKRRLACVACLGVAACAPPAGPAASGSSLHADGVFARADPTVLGARLVPESIDVTGMPTDGSGTVHGAVDGIRFASRTRGSIVTADDRLEGLWWAQRVPPRLGGGFLFVMGNTILRADDWLANPRPIFQSARAVADVFPGLDRFYVRTQPPPGVHVVNGHVAIDPVSGAVVDLGPWPADPIVLAYVAFDGWRALALTDFRGAVATSNAGSTWEQLDIPVRAAFATPVHRRASRDGWLAVTADESSGSVDGVVVSDAPLTGKAGGERVASGGGGRCFLVTPTLDVSALATCDAVTTASPGPPGAAGGSRIEAPLLRAALEDGWPLQNGAAMVADRGNLVLVSLRDGGVVDVATEAYDPALGRCHALSIGGAGLPASAHAAFAFVCGEAAGRTVLLAYDEAARKLRPVRSFSTPRIVQSSSSGSWLVHGPCVDAPSSRAPQGPHRPAVACVGSPDPRDASLWTWREVALAGAPGGAVGLLSDGRVAEVLPPVDVPESRLALTTPDGQRTVLPLRLPTGDTTPERFLGRAVWLGNLDEVEPGVLGGWLAGAGTVVGVQVETDGSVRLGAYVHDLGSPFVAGRYGLGWTRSHHGFETTDGGMTWTAFAAPSPLGPSDVRACGPSGCVGEGWLRVGWGARPVAPLVRLAPAPPPRYGQVSALGLVCDAANGVARGPHPAASDRLQPRATASPFPPPRLAPGEALLHAEVFRGFDIASRFGALGRVYAWGPATRDWAGLGRWQVWWRSPFASPAMGVTTAVTAAQFHDAEDARGELGAGRMGPVTWTVVVGEDVSHALLVAWHHARGAERELFALDEGGRLAPIVRLDGGRWGEIEAGLRVGSEWIIAQHDDARPGATALFRADGRGARNLGTVDRVGTGPNSSVKLARASSGALVGLVVDGESLPDRNVLHRWVVPVELDSGNIGAPESLGAADLSDRTEFSVCHDGASGWRLDVSWPEAKVTVAFGAAPDRDRVGLHQLYARIRISADRTCVEELTGEAAIDELEAARSRSAAAGAGADTAGGPSLPVVVVAASPLELRCTQELPRPGQPVPVVTVGGTK